MRGKYSFAAVFAERGPAWRACGRWSRDRPLPGGWDSKPGEYESSPAARGDTRPSRPCDTSRRRCPARCAGRHLQIRRTLLRRARRATCTITFRRPRWLMPITSSTRATLAGRIRGFHPPAGSARSRLPAKTAWCPDSGAAEPARTGRRESVDRDSVLIHWRLAGLRVSARSSGARSGSAMCANSAPTVPQ